LKIKEEITTEEPSDERHCHHTFLDMVCGMPEKDTSEDPHLDEAKTREFLTEHPRMKTILNANAAFGLVVVAFLYGFYR
jgi:hypothetical protein